MTRNGKELERHRLGRVVDRILTPLIGFGGRLISRPSDEELSEHSGRIRGGEEGQTAVAALEAGRRALGDGHFAEALIQFSLAIERDEESAWAWHGKADAFHLAGQPGSALECYERSLSIEADNPLGHLGRGNALEALGRYQEAGSAWQSALDLDPDLEWAQKGMNRLDERKA